MTRTEIWRRRWAIVLGIGIPAFIVTDVRCEQADIAAGLTHSTGTTLSSFIRWIVEQLGGHGPLIFSITLRGFVEWFEPHILDHLDTRRVELP